MECFLPAKQLRCAITTFCFGCVFLWILSGQYLDRQHRYTDASSTSRDYLGKRALAGGQSLHHAQRRLLEATEEINATQAIDETLHQMVYNRTFNSGGSSGNTNRITYNSSSAQCSDVHKLNRNESRCDFVKTVESCQNDEGLLVYLNFIYCTIPYHLIPLAMVILFFWLIFLFIFLGATAEEYFCPALTVMSKVLHLGQNVAGVTLLALGNGAPDIFSAFAAISQTDDHKSSLAIGALFGAGIFVTTVVVGGVAFIAPFKLTKRPFLRDIIFYTTAVYLTFYVLWTGSVTIYMAAGFIALYVVYVLVVIVGRIVHQRWRNRPKDKPQPSDVPRSGVNYSPPVMRNEGTAQMLSPSSLTNGDVVKVLKSTEKVSKEEGESGVGLEVEESGEGIKCLVNVDSETETESEANFYPVTTDDEAQGELGTVGRHRLRPPPSHLHPPLLRSHQQLGKKPARKRRASGANTPLFSRFGGLLTPPVPRRSITPTANQERGWKYDRRQHRMWDEVERPRSSTPHKLLHTSLSSALDVSEDVAVAVGLPHVSRIWEEIHRVHHHRNSPLIHSRIVDSGKNESHSDSHGGRQTDAVADETTPLLTPPKRPHPFIFLLQALFPFGEDFRQLSIVGKIYEIIKYPCGVILTLTVPVIDYDVELHNWNRWLNILHCVTGPLVVSLLTKSGLVLIKGVFPVWTLVLIIGVLVAIVVACTSRNDRQPVYHCVFAWLGFAIAVVWIYVIANEIVNLLQGFGIVMKVSDGILGITLLAWGNSIGDAVANMTMAKQGFPRMAIGACYGGPLLNMLIGVGVASLYKNIKENTLHFKLYFSQVEFFAAAFLMTTLACSLAAVSLSRFKIYRPFALFLMFFYATFLVVAILAEIPVFKIHLYNVLSDS